MSAAECNHIRGLKLGNPRFGATSFLVYARDDLIELAREDVHFAFCPSCGQKLAPENNTGGASI